VIRVADPEGGRSARSGRPPRWATVGLPLVLAALALVAIGTLVVVQDRQPLTPRPTATSSAGGVASSSDLAGEWSGKGSVTRCAGFDDAFCARTLSLTLTIDCSGKRCVVTPFDRSYGHPPMRPAEGGYGAAGPLPADAAPTCAGQPTSGLWRLAVTVRDGRLAGTYEESTPQSFDCGATGVEWDVTLERG
jgi:hypothetical protein